jgi:hypothetical protein
MKSYLIIAIIVAMVLAVIFVTLNYRQLYSAWAIQRETKRLLKQAEGAPDDFQNPAGVSDNFNGKLSEAFWKFTVINGGGKVGNDTAWHAASYATTNMLGIYHFPDLAFENESSKPFAVPAAGQYNNVTLVGGSGYQPTPTEDIILAFSMQADRKFYGTAGVIFQPLGTLQKNGHFATPLDMFGVSIIGEESSVMGYNGPICYLALAWSPVHVGPLHIDSHTWHDYQVRLKWVSKTQWTGTVSMDGAKLCTLLIPAFGPVEVQVWSDNFLVTETPRRWWEISDAMDLSFQNGGDKQFFVGGIKIYAEAK